MDLHRLEVVGVIEHPHLSTLNPKPVSRISRCGSQMSGEQSDLSHSELGFRVRVRSIPPIAMAPKYGINKEHTYNSPLRYPSLVGGLTQGKVSMLGWEA